MIAPTHAARDERARDGRLQDERPREGRARDDGHVSLLVLGKGTVGGHLFSQIASQGERLARDHDVVVRVVGVHDSRAAIFDEDGIDPARVRAALGADRAITPRGPGTAALRPDVHESLDRLSVLPSPVLVDCTGEDAMEHLYEAAFRRGAHVVSANKRPLAGPLATWTRVLDGARAARRSYRYETTVGAGLPVIETLKNLVRTGDRVRRIEGSLSGTLGYLANELTAGARLSVAVRRARELGYTEPHPGEDLDGADAARKALILARELGTGASEADVRLTPFVPARLLGERDIERFFGALATHDDAMAERVATIRRDGTVLRYLATIDASPSHATADGTAATFDAKRDGPRGATITVGPVAVPMTHPAALLSGAESFVAFYTERYADQPLVVRGAGAGGAVTAAGVLADVLAIARGH